MSNVPGSNSPSHAANERALELQRLLRGLQPIELPTAANQSNQRMNEMSSADSVASLQRNVDQELRSYRQAGQELETRGQDSTFDAALIHGPLNRSQRLNLEQINRALSKGGMFEESLKALKEKLEKEESNIPPEVKEPLLAMNTSVIRARAEELNTLAKPPSASEAMDGYKVTHNLDMDDMKETINGLQEQLANPKHAPMHEGLRKILESLELAKMIIEKSKKNQTEGRSKLSNEEKDTHDAAIRALRQSIELHTNMDKLSDQELVEYIDQSRTITHLGSFVINDEQYRDAQEVEQRAAIELGRRFLANLKKQGVNISDKCSLTSMSEINIEASKATLAFLEKPTYSLYERIEFHKSRLQPRLAIANNAKAIGRYVFDKTRGTKTYARMIDTIEKIMEQPSELDKLISEVEDLNKSLETEARPHLSKGVRARKAKRRKEQEKAQQAARELAIGSEDEPEPLAVSPNTSGKAGTTHERNVQEKILKTYQHLLTFAQVMGFNVPVREEGEILRDPIGNIRYGSDNKPLRAQGRLLTEFDIQLNAGFIECTLKAGGKERQIERFSTHDEVNPLRLPVILYAPNYGSNAEKKLDEVSKTPNAAKIILARTEDELDQALLFLEEQTMATHAQDVQFVRSSVKSKKVVNPLMPRQAGQAEAQDREKRNKERGIQATADAFANATRNQRDKGNRAAQAWLDGKPIPAHDQIISGGEAKLTIKEDYVANAHGKFLPTGRWIRTVEMNDGGFTTQHSLFPRISKTESHIATFYRA